MMTSNSTTKFSRLGSLPVAEGERPAIYVLHENDQWWTPFQEAFDDLGIEVIEWFLDEGFLKFEQTPPPGVFFSRISASAHTRGHHLSKDFARSVLSWLESHDAVVLNGRRVLELEVSKVDQLTTLNNFGIDTPHTVAVFGKEALVAAASEFAPPFISKHNQGGKGASVARFDSHADFAAYLESSDFEDPVDGITLIQEYIPPADGTITRVEFIGGKFLYAQLADTIYGGFQLCPADACEIDPATGKPVIPPGAQFAPVPGQAIFSLAEDFDDPIIGQYEAFLRENGITVAGIEFIKTSDGRLVTYDINTNTNYNTEVQKQAGVSAPKLLAAFLDEKLQAAYPTEETA